MSNDPSFHEPGADAGPPWEVVGPAANEQAAGQAPNAGLAVFDPIEQTLAQIEARHKDVVYDLTTTKGNDAARKARKELVSVRTTADEVYKTWNQPLLAAQKKARELRDGFAARVQLLERPLDEAIKADEDRRAAEKKARDDAEAARIKAIRERIAEIYSLPASCIGKTSSEIETAAVALAMSMIDKEFFAELQGEAEAAADVVRTKLEAMMSAAKASEERAERQRAEAASLAAERAELERQRAELAAQQEAARRAEEERRAAIEREWEQRRILSERIQAEERQRAEAAAAAERAAEAARAEAERQAQERIAEQQRQLDEQRAQFERQQAASRAAETAARQAAEDAELERKLLAETPVVEFASAAPVQLQRTESPGTNGATIVHYVPTEEVKPPVTEQTDAFEVERQAEAARAAALPKPAAKRPDDERLTAAVARAFDVEPAIAAEWLGTYDAFEEIARLMQPA